MTDTRGLDALPIEDALSTPSWSPGTTNGDDRKPPSELGRAKTALIVSVAGILAVVALVVVVRWVLAGASDSEADGGADATDDSTVATNGPTITLTETEALLTDGASVNLTITGFPEEAELHVAQCLAAARPQDPLSARCDTGTSLSTSSAAVAIGVDFTVWRELTIAGDQIDCAEVSCVAQATVADNVATTAAITLEFDSAGPSSLVPRLSATPTVDLVHNQSIQIVGADLPAGDSLRVAQCIVGLEETDQHCDASPTLAGATIDDAGQVGMSLMAKRYLLANGQWHDCAALVQGECALIVRPFEGDPLARLPASLPLAFDPTATDPRDVIALTKADGLIDGESVTAKVSAAFLGSGDPEILQCGVGSDRACAGVLRDNRYSIYSDGLDLWVTFPVLRRFTTSSGGVYDCVETGPCEIQVWTTTGPRQALTSGISFDPDAPFQPPVEVTLDSSPPFVDGEEIEISVAGPDRSVALSQCAEINPEQCEILSSDVFRSNTSSGTTIRAIVHRIIITDRGPYDCVIDGPCVVVPWTGSGETFQSVAVSFDPDGPIDQGTRSTVRPQLDLVDGATVEVRTTDSPRNFLSVSLCHDEVSQCVFLATVRSFQGLGSARFHIPRIIFTAGTVIEPFREYDCAPSHCAVRVEGERSVVDHPVTFRTDIDANDPPEIALDTIQPLIPGTDVTIHGRGFTFLGIDPFDSVFVGVALCADNISGFFGGDCVPVVAASSIINQDGSFSHSFEVPTLDGINFNRPDHPICVLECWLVASGATGLRNALLEVEIYDGG